MSCKATFCSYLKFNYKIGIFIVMDVRDKISKFVPTKVVE